MLVGGMLKTAHLRMCEQAYDASHCKVEAQREKTSVQPE